MKKLILIITIGVLLFSPSEAKAQRIEYDSLGMPYACTNYAYHKKETEKRHLVQGLIFIAACASIMAVEYAVIPSERDNVNNLYRQMGYTGVAVIGASISVGLYRWNVKLQDKIGL